MAQNILKKDFHYFIETRFLFLPTNQEIYMKSSKKNTKSYQKKTLPKTIKTFKKTL